MKRNLLLAAILIVGLWVSSAWAQADGMCEGDFDEDHRVTVDELVTAVNNALKGCAAEQREGCLDSGGEVASWFCCDTAPDFPDGCTIGSCGCSPSSSREVELCDCGEGRCFSRTENGCIDR